MSQIFFFFLMLDSILRKINDYSLGLGSSTASFLFSSLPEAEFHRFHCFALIYK